MQFLYKTPGYILLLFGGFCLSWGGFVIRSFEEANVWQILLLRSFFFMFALMGFLILTYKKNTFKDYIRCTGWFYFCTYGNRRGNYECTNFKIFWLFYKQGYW